MPISPLGEITGRLHLRPAILDSGALAVLFALGTWMYLAHSSHSSAPVERSGRDKLAVIDLRNLNGSPELDWLSTAIAEMLRRDLTETGRFRSLPATEDRSSAAEGE